MQETQEARALHYEEKRNKNPDLLIQRIFHWHLLNTLKENTIMLAAMYLLCAPWLKRKTVAILRLPEDPFSVQELPTGATRFVLVSFDL